MLVFVSVLGPRQAGWLWLIWALATVVWTWPALTTTLDYYRTPGFYPAMAAAAPLTGLAAIGYAWLRRRFNDRSFEILLVLAPVMVLAVVEPVATATVLAVSASCWAAGGWVLRGLGVDGPGTLEGWLLSATAGFAVAGLVLLAGGLLGILTAPVFWTMAVVPTAMGHRRLLEDATAAWQALRAWGRSEASAHPLVGIVVPFAGLASLSGAAVLAAPVIGFDAVNYHLPLAVTYAARASVDLVDHLTYSFFPQPFELLLAWCHALGGVKAAQILPATMLPITAAGAWAVGRRCGVSSSACALAAVVGATLPGMLFSAVNVKNDMLTTIFQLGCLLCFLRWREHREDRLLVLGALLLGASFSVKHTALFCGVGLGAAALYALTQARRPWRTAAIGATICLVSAGPWYWRTYQATGSPTYPVPISFLQGKTDFAGGKPTLKVKPAPPLMEVVFQEMPRALIDAHVDGARVYEAIIPAPIGLFFVLFLPAPWLARRATGSSDARLTALFVVGSLLLWLALMIPLRNTADGNVSLRYVTACLALGPFLLAGGLMRMWDTGGPLLRTALAGALAYSSVLCWMGGLVILNSGAQAAVLTGRISEQDYLHGAMVQYEPVRVAGEQTAPGEKVLAMGDCATLYFDPPWDMECGRVRSRLDVTSNIAGRLGKGRRYDYLILNRAYRLDAEAVGLELELVHESRSARNYRVRSLDE